MSAVQVVEHPQAAGRPMPLSGASLDSQLVRRLRAGDTTAFAEIVEGWSRPMLGVARSFVSTESSAEEIVQETWLAVVRGLDRFEGRSSLRTWVFRILCNLARTCGSREARTVPWSSFPPTSQWAIAGEDHSVGCDDARAVHMWSNSPDSSVIAGETRRLLAAALLDLPVRQREVVSLRDVQGLSAEEVCRTLGVTAANQRVLLHRGRTRLRAALAGYYYQD